MEKADQQVLKKYASAQHYFKPPQDTETIVKFVKFGGLVVNHFDKNGPKIPRYVIDLNGDLMIWDRPSKSLAAKMSDYKEGDVLGITRRGIRNYTRYEIRKIENV